jgi:hypothetical protein
MPNLEENKRNIAPIIDTVVFYGAQDQRGTYLDITFMCACMPC